VIGFLKLRPLRVFSWRWCCCVFDVVLFLQPFVVVARAVIVCKDAHNIGGYDEAYSAA
jgi:hypothetical protein